MKWPLLTDDFLFNFFQGNISLGSAVLVGAPGKDSPQMYRIKTKPFFFSSHLSFLNSLKKIPQCVLLISLYSICSVSVKQELFTALCTEKGTNTQLRQTFPMKVRGQVLISVNQCLKCAAITTRRQQVITRAFLNLFCNQCAVGEK